MSDEARADHGGAGHLVAMANDIGNYFRPQAREEAIAGIASHIQRYWTPRMRAKLNAHIAQGAAELDDLPREALRRLNEESRRSEAPKSS